MDTNELFLYVEKFKQKTFTKKDWTHEAHLVIGVWYCFHLPKEKVFPFLKENISALNEKIGVENSDSSGYHETITLFWIWVIQEFIKQNPKQNILNILTIFLKSNYSKQGFILEFYSKELLKATTARKHFIKPDLKPIKKL
ncbi:hypothetical protein [Aureivirga sp. CE67]|uniref:hypothetical protein n=1 Tax=Aureivirga sp. CE67 TaxID=1788983 RepID=UPI0018CA4E57|nr:hypothetical protein [Aureivirga sp. CE67]